MTTKAITPLQQRMLEDMQLRGLSARTQEAYARAVWQLAQHYHRSPDQLSEEELRQYFLYLTNEKKIARPTATTRSAASSSSTNKHCSNSGPRCALCDHHASGSCP